MTEAEQVYRLLLEKNMKLVTAESCTGGKIAAAITDIAGSSDVFDRGFVTYSNLAKTEQLGVSAELIVRHGAVSEPVATAMAEGALRHSAADIAISVTGVAGPGGGTAAKPVGLVYFGYSDPSGTKSEMKLFGNLSRSEIRQQAVRFAFQFILRQLVSAP
jgi:nicotinamide-nucleotide amidase